MDKTVIVTMLDHDEASAKSLYETVSRYAKTVKGFLWVDDLDKMAWREIGREIVEPGVACWVVSGKPGQFARSETRFGLAMCAIALQARRGAGFPILLVPDGELDPETLPTPLRGAEIVPPAQLGAKVAARSNMPVPRIARDYTLNVIGMPGIGLWLEVGPAPDGEPWTGAMLGVAGTEADIDFHGVGVSGQLPEKTTLEYPMQGLKLDLDGREYTAWAVQNTLPPGHSYFARITGRPDSVVFGELGEDMDSEETDVYRLEL
jgi:hypothetical protein